MRKWIFSFILAGLLSFCFVSILIINFNPLLVNFNDRVIGSAVLEGVNILARTNVYIYSVTGTTIIFTLLFLLFKPPLPLALKKYQNSKVSFHPTGFGRFLSIISPLILIPLLIPISNELQYFLNRYFSLNPRIIFFFLCIMAFVVSAFFYRYSKLFNLEKLLSCWYFPVIIVTFGVFKLYTNYIEVNYFDMFHNGENLLPVQQLFMFGKVPFINLFPTHGLSNISGQILYSLVNGYRMFEPWLWEWIPKIFEMLLLYFLLKRVFGKYISFLLIIFTPILNIFGGDKYIYGYIKDFPETYYLMGIFPALIIPYLFLSKNLNKYFIYSIVVAFMFLWRVDFGIATLISSIVLIVFEFLLSENKKNAAIKVTKALFPYLILTGVVLAILFKSFDGSLAHTVNLVIQFIKIQGPAQGFVQMADMTKFNSILQYILLPFVSVLYLSIFVFKRLSVKTRSSPIQHSLVFLAIFSLILSIRSTQRHTILFGLNYYLFLFLLGLFPVYINEARIKFNAVVFLSLILVSVWFTGKTNRLSNLTNIPTFHYWAKSESRVRVNNVQFREISDYISSSLNAGETFYDATSIPLLYVTTGKEFIPYFIPNVYLTSDLIQYDTVARMEQFRKKNKLKLILAENPDKEGSFLDGVPNGIRSFLIFEYLNKNYRYSQNFNGYNFWYEEGKEVVSANETLNIKKLPLLWGESLNPKINRYQGTTIIRNGKLERSVKYRFDLPKEFLKLQGNYLLFSINSPVEGNLNISFPNGKSTVSFDVLAGIHDYAVRISAVRDWFILKPLYIYLSAANPLEIIAASVRIGD